jgi:hypothetical protein
MDVLSHYVALPLSIALFLFQPLVVGRHRDHMLAVAVRLLRYAVDRGWSAVSTRIVEGLQDVYSMDLDAVLQLSAAEGMPILHRYDRI